ncbi:TIGR00289 family protein [Candidatus Bathyarchaeota archaeon]|jgi:predicted ATP pyrophosphatase (TIGR00289 family)|nr:TIGR00289 family protein [Candidatus Bathyarchaeota archaeon]
MRVAVLVSGGKDSALALNHALNDKHEVVCLASVIPLKEDSWMFHYPNIRLVDLFSEAVGMPLVKAESSGVKEEEVEDLRRLIQRLNVEGVVTGAIASTYQKTRIDMICEQLGLKSIAPLWHRDPLSILKELVDLNFNAIMTGVYAYGFTREWLGKRIDAGVISALEELNKQYGVSLVGEGGEYETLVLDGPIFKKRIEIVDAETVWKGQSGCFLVKKAVLENK